MRKGTGRRNVVAWAALASFAGVAAAAACGADTTTADFGGSSSGGSTSSSSSGSSGAPAVDAGPAFNPVTTPCTGHGGKIICVSGSALTCDASEQQTAKADCGDGACVPGQGCVTCVAGQFSCYGNQLRSCNAGPPPTWSTVSTCNPASEVCRANPGACVPLTVTGGTTANGKYYRYARFTAADSVFKGGFDIDSYENKLYVNRVGGHLDVYQIDILDSDGDGKIEPNQHPDNPEATGPVEQRVLTFVQTYDIPQLGPPNSAELFAQKDRINWVVGYPAATGNLFEYVFATGVLTQLANVPSPAGGLAFLGRDDTTGTWYSGAHYERTVYSYHEPTKSWVTEFKYPDLAGDHMDGMEVVTNQNSGTTYVYVSDMTSDFIAQYVRERGGGWVQKNLFSYEGTADMVEGLGFGAFNHFWVSGYPTESIYEIGGGSLAKFTEPTGPAK